MFFDFGFGFYSLDNILFMAFKRRRRRGRRLILAGWTEF
jgi:hypothetical protein